MKKFCLALIGLAFGGVASAITIGWQWSALDSSLVEGSSYYMVYSTNGNLTAEDAVVAAANGHNTVYKGTGSGWGSTLNTSGMPVSDTTVIPGPEDNISVVDDPNGNDVMLTFDTGNNPLVPNVDAGETGYLYLVIFNAETISGSSQFAVGKAPTTVTVNDEGQVVQGDDQLPGSLKFQAPVWLGGTHRAAPEPTTLALLALGIAGVALRRRVR